MPGPTKDSALDHLVVVMFENRSFDSVLGRLYQPGEVASFEGVLDKDLSNPIPTWAEHRTDRDSVPYGVAAHMDTPNPDPGEEYPHVNTQLFGIIDPGNQGVAFEKMTAPYNAPSDPQQTPTMDGFVADYISTFTSGVGRQPTYDEYAQIMTGYTPEQVPVLSSLARGFATFDHWFCEVPSQTFTNRSFFNAGSASGFVVNMAPADAFPVHNTAETIFERLEAQGLTWRVYCDPSAVVPFTGLIHAARLRHRFQHFFSTDEFLEDAANGDLPTYSFIEPNLMQGHNDMHPAYNVNYPGMSFDPPSSLLGGEAFLGMLYNAIRASSSANRSNVYNTTLLVVFDEHGGTYDHVPPPLAPPPGPSAVAGQLGFTFERSGVRLPAIAISPWVDERTVVTDVFRSTSVLATLRERWSLGAPFSAREAMAPTLRSVLSRETPRDPGTWPDVVARPVPPFDETLIPLEAPLSGLAEALFFGFLAFGRDLGQAIPDYTPDTPPDGAEALAVIRDLFGHLYPNLGL